MKLTAFSPHNEIYVNYTATNKKHNMSIQHYHDGYEIYLQTGGKRYLFYDNICYTLQRGDMAVFRPFDIHYAQSLEADYYERYVLNFKPEMLKCILTAEEIYFLEQKISSGIIHLNEDDTQKLCESFNYACSYLNKDGFLAYKLLCCAVMGLIMNITKYIDRECDNVKGMISEGKQVEEYIISASKYINKHYMENISLEMIADAAHISKCYLSRKFRTVTGATVIEYINNVRLTKVHSLLINTNITIEEIAEQTGFSSSGNLSRVFKNIYGISPRTFRKNNSNQK